MKTVLGACLGVICATGIGAGCGGESASTDTGTHFFCQSDEECVERLGNDDAVCVDDHCHPDGVVHAPVEQGEAGSDAGAPEPSGVAAENCPAEVDVCWECGCANCETEWDACMGDEQCKAILDCSTEVGCDLDRCYDVGQCVDVIDAAGGQGGDLWVAMIFPITGCRSSNACPCETLAPLKDRQTADPLEGVEMCFVSEPDHCATSDRHGVVRYGLLPTDGDERFTLQKDGYMPILQESIENFNARLPTTADVEEWASQQGVAWDETKGIIQYDVGGGGVPTVVTAALNPLSGTFTPPVVGGLGIGPHIWNVDPGTYDLTLDHPSLTCEFSLGEVGIAVGSARVEARAGFLTRGARFECQ